MWVILFIATSALLISNGQSQSVDCSGPPKGHPCDCCPMMPKFLTPEIASECGLPPMPPAGSRPPGPPPGGPPSGGPHGPSCESVNCILNKNNLISGGKVNRQAFLSFMLQQYGSEWKSAIENSVQACNSEIDVNVSDCEPRDYFKCYKGNMLKNCPDSVWSQTADCIETKKFVQNCPMPGPMG